MLAFPLHPRYSRMLLAAHEFGCVRQVALIAALTQVKGIGVWTAHMFLMFALRRGNVLPTGDFGIRSAIQKAYRKRKMPDAKTIEKLAKPWHPHCTVACWYLWRSLDEPRERAAAAANKPRAKTPRQ